MNKNAWDFATAVAFFILIFFAIREMLPHLKEIGVHAGADGSVELKAFTHDRNEISDAHRPFVLEGNA